MLDSFLLFSSFCLTMIYDIKLFLFKVIIIPVGKICLFCRGTRREREREWKMAVYAIFKTARKLMPTSWRAIKCG